jgi:hypothetical protein
MVTSNLSERWEEYYSTAIQKGLKAALADLSIEHSFDEIENGHIKLNKLMYVAMAERGLHEEMQHSWHRYGGDLGTLVPSTRTVEPVALSELPETEQPPRPSEQSPRSSSDDSKAIWDERDYCAFFKTVSIGSLESLREILEADRTTLLEEFYQEYSGDIEAWVDLYLINVRIQEFIHQYAENGLHEFGTEEYLDFVETLEAFEKELYSHRELSPASLEERGVTLPEETNPADLLASFLDLVEDVYFTISRRDVNEFTGDLSYQLGMIEEFYHERAWNVVTKVISLNTTHGPNQEALLRGAVSDLETLLSGYEIRMDRIESECRAVDLLPSEGDSEEPDDEVADAKDEKTDAKDEKTDASVGEQLPTQEEFRDALNGGSE